MLHLQNRTHRVEVHDDSEAVWFRLSIRDSNGDWIPVLTSGALVPVNIWTPDTHLVCEDPDAAWRPVTESRFQQQTGLYRTACAAADRMELAGHMGPHPITTRITLTGDGGIYLATRLRILERTQVARCMNHLYLAPHGQLARSCEPLDFAWLPALHLKSTHVCSDHYFRAPVTIAMARGFHAALIPDLEIFAAGPAMQHALDLRVTDTCLEGPRLSYGLCCSEPDGHVYFEHRPESAPVFAHTELVYACTLFLGQGQTPAAVVDRVNAHLWQKYGRPLLADPRPQVLPFAEYGTRYTFRHELPASVRFTERKGVICAGIENRARRGANFHAWENDLHMGYGFRHYGQTLADARLQDIADSILNLMCAAPRHQGAFPCIYNFETETYEGTLFWTARSADALRGYDTGAMSVTIWWLLKWIEDFDDLDRTALLSLAETYCTFLMQQQLASGAIPTYFQADLVPAAPLRESATTAISGAVLAQCACLLRRPALTRAAMRAGGFIESRVLPGLAFDDFETFYSCSPKPLHAIDYWSGIRPHNNLSMQWACDMYLALYRQTGEEHWLDSGRFLLNVLSLYQQIWNPSHLPGYLFGGFGVMNTDGEWNDGRQARFTTTYADYFRATGHPEYLERAVAACRAAFALMDMPENHANHINDVVMPHLGAGKGYAPENIHHRGRDSGYGWSGMNWSAAGGLAASAYLERHLGTVFLDTDRCRAYAVDGVAVDVQSWRDNVIHLHIHSSLRALPVPWQEARDIIIRAGGWEREDEEPADLLLIVNDEVSLTLPAATGNPSVRYHLSA